MKMMTVTLLNDLLSVNMSVVDQYDVIVNDLIMKKNHHQVMFLMEYRLMQICLVKQIDDYELESERHVDHQDENPNEIEKSIVSI